jgi:hypothetical protein
MATENIQIKFTVDKTQLDGAVASSKTLEAELKKAGVSAQYMDSALEGVDEALKEAGVDAKTFNKALEQSAQSTKTLRTQLAEAKNEAVRMSQQFGAFSKEAQNAAKKAALIKDEIGDLNDTLDALNPDAKLNAFVKLGQGIQGGFQAATGALQLFGVENERITKLAQQFQGVLNLTQGINSVLQLKDVYGQLRLVLGVTTTAQRGLNAAMLSNPFTAVAVALGAVITAMFLFSENTDDAAKSQEDLADATKETNEELEKQFRNLVALDNLNRRGSQSAEQVVLRIKNGTDLLAFSTKELNNALSNIKDQYNELTPENIVLFDPNGVKTQQDLTNEYNRQKRELEGLIKLLEKEVSLRGNKGASDQIDKTTKAIQKLGLENVRTNLEFNNISDEGILKLNKALELLEASFFEVRLEAAKVNEELEKTAPISVEIAQTSADLDKELFARLDKEEQDRRDRRLREAAFALSVAQETASVISAFSQAQYTEELQALEESKRQGAISEERYQEKLRKIKRKAAEEDKKYQIFQATMGAAQAIINALNVTPSSAIPFAVALASITGAANLAKIAATPIPKFKTGTLNVGGGNVDADGGMHAIIHRGEAVIPADRNRDYHPTISALFKRQIKPSDINSFVEMKLKGRMNNTVNAKINARELAGVMPKNDNVNIRNSALLARQIGKEIARNNDPRMR